MSTCTGTGDAPCISDNEADRLMCLTFTEQDRDSSELLDVWRLALELHAGSAAARAAIAARYDVLGGFLMLRGGTNFLDACRADVAAGRFGSLLSRIVDLERDHVHSGYLKREGDRIVPARAPDYAIPKSIDPGGSLFPETEQR